MDTGTESVEPLHGAVGFARALRTAGVIGGVDATAAFLRALDEIDVSDRRQVYWAGRVTLCREPDDLPRYDLAFAGWFGALEPGTRRRGGRPRTAAIAGLDDAEAHSGQDQPVGQALRVAASDTEMLRHRDIAELSATERAHLAELIAGLRVAPPMRRGLRWQHTRQGSADPRATLRAMIAAGGETVRPLRRGRARRPRPVVLLIDVSGSMRPYADALLRFAHVLTHGTTGAAGRADVDVFSMGTRMARLTRALRTRDAELALAAAGQVVPDWAGGTRLGEALRAFLTRYGRRGTARGATVVLFSDGWERGDPTLLGEQMSHLHRLAHAVIWANPHAGSRSYRPVQSGIATALPHIDRLIAGHSLTALQELLTEVRDA